MMDELIEKVCSTNIPILQEALDTLLEEDSGLIPDEQLDGEHFDAVNAMLGILHEVRLRLCDCCGKYIATRQDYRHGSGGEFANLSKYASCEDCFWLNDVAYFDQLRAKKE